MNREILFRGKRLDNGEWAVGSLVRAVTGEVYWIDSSYADGLPHIETISEKTIGQCTGLTDKNGVKIFEGDIVCFEDSRGRYKGVIYWDTGAYWVDCTSHGSEEDIFGMGYIKVCGAEVIGNIHDNPELMEA